MKTTQHKATKSETVAERAVRGALAGYIYAERFNTRVTSHRDDGLTFLAYFNVPRKSIDTMLRRERAASKKKGKK